MIKKKKKGPIQGVDPDLADLGFKRIKPVRRTRISMEVSSKTKAGKTRLTLTMTEPIGILNTDRALEDILPEFPNVDVIVKDFSQKIAPGEKLNQAQAKLLEAEFDEAYQALMEHKHIRSVSVDKWTTIWEVARFAEFGVASVKAHHYVPVNLRMRGYASRYQEHNKNVLFLQDMKEEWVGDKPTGRFIVDGFKYTPGLVQVNAFMWREEETDAEDQGFRLKITGCGLNAELVGWEFKNEGIDFRKIASMVLVDTKASDWR